MVRDLRRRPVTLARLNAAVALALSLWPAAGTAAPRVLSLDQCADEYVLALAPRAAIVGLSTRADDADSLLAARARGLPLRRVDLETGLATRPQLVVRTYGGDARLVRALAARGVRVLTLQDATDFDGVRDNLRDVGAAVGAQAEAAAMISDMDARLARAAGAWKGRSAIYLTPAGYSAGPGTLADAMLRAAGLANAEQRRGFVEAPLERLVLEPPQAVVTAFFDTVPASGAAWSPGRHALMRQVVREHAVANLPGALIACPNWGAAQAVELLARKAPR